MAPGTSGCVAGRDAARANAAHQRRAAAFRTHGRAFLPDRLCSGDPEHAGSGDASCCRRRGEHVNLNGSTLFFILLPTLVLPALAIFCFAPLLADRFDERQNVKRAQTLAQAARGALVDRAGPAAQVPPQGGPAEQAPPPGGPVAQPPRPRSGEEPGQVPAGTQAEPGAASRGAAGDRQSGRPGGR
jgi:hypothetical protein